MKGPAMVNMQPNSPLTTISQSHPVPPLPAGQDGHSRWVPSLASASLHSHRIDRSMSDNARKDRRGSSLPTDRRIHTGIRR